MEDGQGVQHCCVDSCKTAFIQLSCLFYQGNYPVGMVEEFTVGAIRVNSRMKKE